MIVYLISKAVALRENYVITHCKILAVSVVNSFGMAIDTCSQVKTIQLSSHRQ